jgi:hypothetical protein
MFKFLRNLTVFGLLYAGYKWLTERICKDKDATKSKSVESEGALGAKYVQVLAQFDGFWFALCWL